MKSNNTGHLYYYNPKSFIQLMQGVYLDDVDTLRMLFFLSVKYTTSKMMNCLATTLKLFFDLA